MNEQSNIKYNGKINYENLRQIIFDYYKETKGIQLGSVSIGYLKDKLSGNDNGQPFFIMENEFGEARFDIPMEDIESILKSYMASKNYEISDLKYGDSVYFSYQQNLNINKENQENAKLDILYKSGMDYNYLRQIICDYYKETKGIQLGSVSIDYLKDKLSGNDNGQPFFIMKNEFGETRFDIPKEDIESILKSYMANKNCELKGIKFGDKVEVEYKLSKNIVKEKDNLSLNVNEINSTPENNNVSLQSEIQNIEQPKETKQEVITQENTQITKEEPQAELVRMEREKRKFTILQRERTMSDEKKAKNKSAIMAGLCILGAAIGIYFNQQDPNQVIQNEIRAIYSWESLVQYIKDLGPLTTILSAGAGAFVAKYFKHSKKYKKAQDEFVDFNASLENTQILGGNENDKTR